MNWLRNRTKEWRDGKLTGIPYDGASSITKELLVLWRGDSSLRKQRLFFAQVEAVETIIFLVEANPIYRKGMPEIPVDHPGENAREAGFKRIRQELGSGKGRSPHWLIFNDESHYAYRRGDSNNLVDLEEDASLAKKNAREAMIWIEGLDRINKLAGGRKKGIKFGQDLSIEIFVVL